MRATHLTYVALDLKIKSKKIKGTLWKHIIMLHV